MALPSPPLLLVTDRRQARAPLDELVGAAFAAGCRWASLREKDLPPAEQVALARRLLPIARASQARLTLHGDPVLAHAAGLDGVHLSAGGNPALARQLLGRGALIGISIHTATEAEVLDPAVVDYAIAGPAYATPSKPGHGPFLAPRGIGDICRATSVPIIAIGGITADEVTEMQGAGAAGVAVMGSIMRAEDPAAEMKRLVAEMTQPRPR
ncbi:MAG: thiamine phosphate synthase [Xanthobacteraceae bacterium]